MTYQGCWEGGICYPPVTKELSLADVGLIKAGQIAATVAESVETPAVAQVDTSGASSIPATPLSAQDQFVETLTKASLMSLLAIFFVAGLALSMTPCVFPMIPILSGIIAGQGHRVNTRKGLALSVVYVLAMAVTYTIAE